MASLDWLCIGGYGEAGIFVTGPALLSARQDFAGRAVVIEKNFQISALRALRNSLPSCGNKVVSAGVG